MEKITSRREPRCVHVKNLGASKAYRDENEEFLCDGKKLLEEAIKSNAEIVNVFTTSRIMLPHIENTRIYNLSSDIMQSLSPLKKPQEVLFTCKKPNLSRVDYHNGTHILLDNVQDPGNVGTIIRSADAFGTDSVILFGDTADPYNPKAVRASMGAIFKQRVSNLNIDDLVFLKESGARFVGTSGDRTLSDRTPGGCAFSDITAVKLNNSIIVMGNEGNGISKEVLALCNEIMTIPLVADCDSLNVAVAASIIMWEARGR